MARSAYVLGGTGQIGSAVALRLAAADWDVTVAARTRERLSAAVGEVAQFVSVDREAGLSLPGNVDALVEVISMTRARWLGEERPPLGGYMETFIDYSAGDSFVRDLAA